MNDHATDDYAPFPERELITLAEQCERMLTWLSPTTKLYANNVHRAEVMRDAVKCHDALRARCLTAEMENRALRARLEAAA